MGRVRFVEEGDERIVVIDFSNLLPTQLGPVVDEAKKLISRQDPKSVFTMTIVHGARFNNETISQLKDFARANDPYVKAGSIVGLTGLQQLVLTAVSKFTGRTFHVCKNEAEAKRRLLGR